MLLRHLASVLLLPFVVTVVLPYFLLQSYGIHQSPWPVQALGLAITALGFGLFAWCVSLFARVGQGTLAPWDPTRALVAAGPYRLVRNPMITGVLAMLAGEALWFGSAAVGWWALAFFASNHVYFILSEEPGLEARFGQSYRDYKARVPRWLPKIVN